MRHITARARVARPIRALLAAVLVMAVGVAPAGAEDPVVIPAAESSSVSEPSEESPAGESDAQDSASEAVAGAPSSAAPRPSAMAPKSPILASKAAEGVSVTRRDGVDTITVHDPEGELWQWGGKASREDIFALKANVKITEVLSVTADGRELEDKAFGWTNTRSGAFIGFDLQALHTIPPVELVVEAKTEREGDYEIAESDEVPARDTLQMFEAGADSFGSPSPVVGTLRQAETFRPLDVTRTNYWNRSAYRNQHGFRALGRGAEVTINEGAPGNTAFVHSVRIHYKRQHANNKGGDLLLAKKQRDTINRQVAASQAKNCTPQAGYGECLEFPVSQPLDFWSGDTMAVYFKGNSANGNDYHIEVLGRTASEDLKDYSWTESVESGSLITTATNAKNVGRSDVVMTRTINKDSKISGPIDAQLTHNGFDLNSDVSGQELIIQGPDGKELYRAAGKAGETRGVSPIGDWAGVRFSGPQGLQVPAGSKIIVKMNYNRNNRMPVKDSSVDAPIGPGKLTYTEERQSNFAYPNQRISVCATFTERTPLTGFKIVPNSDIKAEIVDFNRDVFYSQNGLTDIQTETNEKIDGDQVTARYSDRVKIPRDANAYCALITVDANRKINPDRVADDFVMALEHDLYPNEPDSAFERLRTGAPQGWDKPTVSNPELPKRCGQNIAIVMDASNSVIVENGIDAMANSALRIVNSLEGTGTSVGIYNFGSQAPRFTKAEVTSTPIYDEAGANNVRRAIESYRSNMKAPAAVNSVGAGSTNWEAALEQIRKYNEENPSNRYDAVYFVTDGFPTYSSAGEGLTGGAEGPSAGMVHVSDVTRARDVADQVKIQGSYIQPVLVNVDPSFKEPVAKDSTVPYYRVDAYRKARNALPGDILYLWEENKNGTFVRHLLNQGAMDIFQVARRVILGKGFGDVLASPRKPQPRPDASRPKTDGQVQLDQRDWSTWAAGERTPIEIGNVIGDDNARVAETFGELDAILSQLALANCTGSVTLSKDVVDANGNAVNNPKLSGWHFEATTPEGAYLVPPAGQTGRVTTRTAETDSTGQVEFHLETDTPDRSVRVNIVEHEVNGYSLFPRNGKNAVCTVRYGDGRDPVTLTVNNLQNGFQLVARSGEIVTCAVSNAEDPKNAGFRIDKVDQDGKPIDGARFDVYRASNATGTEFAGDPVWTTGSTSTLEPGGYVLVERKAPAGYALLPRPIRFDLTQSSEGVAIQVETGADFVVGKGFESATSTAFLKVANVLQGELPKTGGIGVYWTTLLSFFLMALGGSLAVRRTRA